MSCDAPARLRLFDPLGIEQAHPCESAVSVDPIDRIAAQLDLTDNGREKIDPAR